MRWIRFFAERGHIVGLASQHKPEHGLEVAQFFQLSTSGRVPGTRLFNNVREVKNAIRAFSPHVLHAHYINESGWLGALSGFHPFALTAWGSDVYLAPSQSRLARYLSPFSVKRADYVTADSFDQIEFLKRMGARSGTTEMIPWGVDLDSYDRGLGIQWRRKHAVSQDTLIVLSPRQWISNSNIDIIVDAWSRVQPQCPKAHLFLKRMQGQEEFNAKIESQIERLGLASSVSILNEMPEADLPAMYAAADVVVSICSSDGTPVSVLEAMAAGTAIIASDLSSLRQWVEADAGFLVDPRDPDALALHLIRILNNTSLRQGFSAGARRIAEKRAGREENLVKVETALHTLSAQMKHSQR